MVNGGVRPYVRRCHPKKIAAQLSHLFRSSDIVSRIGEDEFMAMLQGALGGGQVMAVADRILECFDRVLEELPKDCSITCSTGIAVCPEDGRISRPCLKSGCGPVPCKRPAAKAIPDLQTVHGEQGLRPEGSKADCQYHHRIRGRQRGGVK